MEIEGNRIIFEGTPIATIDGGWPTLIERFSDILLGDGETEKVEILERQIDNLEQEIQDLKNELDERE